MYFALGLGVLALCAGFVYRSRLVELVKSETALSDDMVRQIETSGWVDIDEPLDHGHIREEEDRFLEEEAWDEPEEW